MTTTLLPVVDVADAACCTPLTKEAIDADRAQELAQKLKALADPTRLRLVSIVAASDDDEACVCDLVEPVGLSQPTVSHHLKVLRDAGWISGERRGTWIWYSLRPEAVARFRELAGGFSPSTPMPLMRRPPLPVVDATA